MADALNEKVPEYSEETYRTLVVVKSVLVIMDDVWTQNTVSPFLTSSGRSRLLYTSREKGRAPSVLTSGCTMSVAVMGDCRKADLVFDQRRLTIGGTN